jgi:hypothetical protein
MCIVICYYHVTFLVNIIKANDMLCVNNFDYFIIILREKLGCPICVFMNCDMPQIHEYFNLLYICMYVCMYNLIGM